MLKGFSDYLGRVSEQHAPAPQSDMRDIASGKLSGPSLEVAAAELQESLAAFAARRDADRSPAERALASSCLIQMRADDPAVVTNAEGRVIVWPSRANLQGDARQVLSVRGPKKAKTTINGRSHTIVRFDGESLLEIVRRVPANGSLFVVFRAQDTAGAGQRIVGWEDSDAGKHGLGIMLESGGRLHAILRNNGQSGDLVHQQKATDFEMVGLTWGPNGTTLHRDGKLVGSQKGIVGVSADPNIQALRLGGPGSGGSPRFRGEVAEVRVYNRQLDESERALVEAEMFVSWLDPHEREPPPSDPVAELYDEMVSARGPFWLTTDERRAMLPREERSRLDALNRELEVLKTKPPVDIPRAVVVQDGGPKGTRHEGFKDAQVFLRGNSKRLGKTVPRGIPRVFVGDQAPQLAISNGSGRRELADWLTRSDNPLAARVMVNRIWQRHFGEGLVRTPNDFGERGERPTHPALLDHLAAQFVESGWSVKTMHRMIMLSSTYQQSSRASSDALAIDPENRFLGRVNRRRLDAESIRDALLSVAGRLDTTLGGAAFADLAMPRRTLYLQSVRTGPSASDFGRLFDRADPGSMVAQRGESVVAPQSLFFLNDPFVSEQARSLAGRVVKEVNSGQLDQIRQALRSGPRPAANNRRVELRRSAFSPRKEAPGNAIVTWSCVRTNSSTLTDSIKNPRARR